MTNYEKVRKAIIEAVPEIMELDFGCVVRTYIFSAEPMDFRIAYKTYKSNVFVCENNNGDQFLLHESDVEILGREIRLSDVLRAIEKKNGIEGVYPPELFAQGHPAKWNLPHDALSWHKNNRPEVIEFLAEILTK